MNFAELSSPHDARLQRRKQRTFLLREEQADLAPQFPSSPHDSLLLRRKRRPEAPAWAVPPPSVAESVDDSFSPSLMPPPLPPPPPPPPRTKFFAMPVPSDGVTTHASHTRTHARTHARARTYARTHVQRFTRTRSTPGQRARTFTASSLKHFLLDFTASRPPRGHLGYHVLLQRGPPLQALAARHR